MAQAIRLISSNGENRQPPRPPGGGSDRQSQDARLASAFGDLEGALIKINSMATLAADTIERTICPAAQEAAGKPNCYYIDEQRANAAVYAVMRVQTMLAAFTEAYYKTLDAG